jgi:acyl-CoA dehydrogenase
MGVLDVAKPAFMAEEDIAIFHDAVGKFFDEHAPEAVVATWRKNHVVDRDMWTKSGAAGLLGLSIPRNTAGGGDYRHEVVLMEQLGLKGVDGFGISACTTRSSCPTSSNTARRSRSSAGCHAWHRRAGRRHRHDRARRGLGPARDQDHRHQLVGDQYVINGSKTFITNGQTANLIIVVAKTDPEEGARGTSLVIVETDGAEGFERGRNLDKLGHEAQDTSELFFNDVKVPTQNLLGGDEGRGFIQLMGQLPQERLNIAVQGMATIERALELTIAYVKERKAFGKAGHRLPEHPVRVGRGARPRRPSPGSSSTTA